MKPTKKLFCRVAGGALLLLALWIGFYCYRSSNGAYHEHTQDGGIVVAMWHPTDFQPREIAPEAPPGPRKKYERFAPRTILPKSYPMDAPLVAIDRLFFHKTTQMISGQGDMGRLFELSADGRKLIAVDH